MSNRSILIIAIAYSVLTFTLNNVLGTAIGELLMQLSYLALFVGLLGLMCHVIKFSIDLSICERRGRKGIE